MIFFVEWIVVGVLATILTAIGGKALKSKSISSIAQTANDTLALYESRIAILEAENRDVLSKVDKVIAQNELLKEMVLQKADLKRMETKLNRLLRANGQTTAHHDDE